MEPDWDSDMRRLRAEVDQSIRHLALEVLRVEHENLQQMIERMLVSPTRVGIAVVIIQEPAEELGPDHWVMHETRNYRLDEHVPFGHIFEFPSLESYHLWEERGWPDFDLKPGITDAVDGDDLDD